MSRREGAGRKPRPYDDPNRGAFPAYVFSAFVTDFTSAS